MSTLIENFLKSAKKPLIVILGPTASGKTALSLKIAKKYNCEIISTDSRQIYKEMEIGTDAITLEEQNGIPHHMLGITTPDKTITMSEYVDLALEKIEEIYSRGHIPILVGGTGLYISAIIERYDMPKIPPNEKLREELEKMSTEDLHEKLKKLNPEAAERIHPNNRRYVIRAIEIATADSPKKASEKPHFDVYMIGIKWPREELYQRVNYRVDRQIERGLLDEVKKLLKKGYAENLPSMSSLGVKEIIPYLKGESTLEECLNILKQSTRKYAKRQMTWFRRYDNVEWITPDKIDTYV
ncbi:tRNA (adenosine(37)-N6)-dimethylallyltransferase MiaA [Candidatus Peregrinibacteria bacterium CG10_big_fil_rev_8_21_14_0_10_36_19]|nr:MAG: tRNA (adenosine(37)-N6)-dimethylallyltransferase MiaA [Candidatus Peregrinibacteria bacterium CG10_big_fil_rev_8_21_14_0_10_36_19]